MADVTTDPAAGTTTAPPRPKRVRTRTRTARARTAAATAAGATADWTPPDLVAARDFTLGSVALKEGKPVPADLVAGLGERGVARLRRRRLVKGA